MSKCIWTCFLNKTLNKSKIVFRPRLLGVNILTHLGYNTLLKYQNQCGNQTFNSPIACPSLKTCALIPWQKHPFNIHG